VLLNGFERNAPTFELVALALVASVLLFGAGLGLALLVRINSIFYPLQDLRYVHPTTEKELVTLVKKAQSEGLALRVRGSAHSVYQAIYADESPPGNINVQLDLYNRILHWDTTRKRVTVQAGCHL
jgi:FAD/FMN-containing dehydrogenase